MGDEKKQPPVLNNANSIPNVNATPVVIQTPGQLATPPPQQVLQQPQPQPQLQPQTQFQPQPPLPQLQTQSQPTQVTYQAPPSYHPPPAYGAPPEYYPQLHPAAYPTNYPCPPPPTLPEGYQIPVPPAASLHDAPMYPALSVPAPDDDWVMVQSPIVKVATRDDFAAFIYPTVHSQSVLQNSHVAPVSISQVPSYQVNPDISAQPHILPLQQQPEALITFAPFTISPESAAEYFIKWKEELWFTPSDFAAKMCEAKLKPILMPFYVFDVAVYTSYEGSVGYVTHHHHHSSNGTQNSTRIKWRHASGCRSGTYPTVLSKASVVTEDYEKLDKIDGWTVDSCVTLPMRTEQLGPAVDWSTSFYRRPDGAFAMIEKSERGNASNHLKCDNGADRVMSVSASVKVTSLAYRLVYLPVYFTVFSYNNKAYKVFMNGQTGKIYGERPYGAGGVVNGLKAIGSLFKKKVVPEVISGAELEARDQVAVYNSNSYYISLPPSDTQLKVISVGYITLQNTGAAPIQLFSQQRRTQKQGGAYLLQANQTRSFDFIGEWVIEIVGDHRFISILKWETKGGNKGDDLGMKLLPTP